MNKSKWFYVTIGLICVTCLFLIGSFVAFSFGVPRHTYNKATGKSILNNSEVVSCGDIEAHSIRLTVNGFSYQCGFTTTTSVITYMTLVAIFICELIALILYLKRKKLLVLVALGPSLLVPIGLIILTFLQSKDIHSGSSACQTYKSKFQQGSCSSWVFIASPIINSFGTLISLLLPGIFIYSRCIKKNKKSKESDNEINLTKSKVAPALPEKNTENVQFNEIRTENQSLISNDSLSTDQNQEVNFFAIQNRDK
ncbi:hypothetical protein ENUP19_0044G0012 [Entamoeba nuttalli]|uniref:Transmembrane protein n=2 Tax=Entamoeba nuttalli TaxID=412467 RepID=K2GFJ7_ENTNP|nr:hypothetical protein ENU1_055450 [Entamoeba nuttalli P19]EKE41466.1 hypothetical protein ENU1_055450 [Entamoeba nuttalli P19]|eukprot:XP_008856204.1 hypothetical protein ENU1_055450 [Entamoeba nuttalli P19]